MKVNIINKSNNPNPKYATDGSAGFDLQANIDGNNVVCIEPNETKLISTGLYFEIPKGYKISINSRSSFASQKETIVLNSPGIVDSDFRGEVKIILRNMSLERLYIKNGERIAQGVLEKHETAVFENVEFLSETERGSGGFGSTDAKVTEPNAFFEINKINYALATSETIKLKVGDLITAKNENIQSFRSEPALIIGKEYEILSIDNEKLLFFIKSEVLDPHAFYIGHFENLFDIA